MELALAGVKKITIVNRTEKRGKELLHLLKQLGSVEADFQIWNGDYPIPVDSNVIINCTSIGLYPNTAERVRIKNDTLKADMVVCDLIPNPPKTTFLKEAEARGCKTVDGLGMLVNQGRLGIKYWSGQDVDGAVMRKCLEELFN